MAVTQNGEPGLVSVVVPTYNRADRIGAAIEGILGQTYERLELVVVDDGSQDSTQAVVAQYQQADSRVLYFKKQNGGVATARNRGIEESRGEFIAFCDSDDVWLPDKLKLQVPLFADPEVVLVHSRCQVVDTRGNLSSVVGGGSCRGRCYEALVAHNQVLNSSAVVRRAALDMDDLLDPRREMQSTEDKNLWVRLAHKGKLEAVETPLLQYHINPSGLSSDNQRMLKAELVCLADLQRRFGQEPGAAGLYRKAHWQAYQHYARNFLTMGKLGLALPCILKALKLRPGHGPTWGLLFKCLVPSSLRRNVKRQ